MGKLKLNKGEISKRKAEQMRVGICMGELAYNYRVKGDIQAARSMMIKASKAPKYVYLAALHALAVRLDKPPTTML